MNIFDLLVLDTRDISVPLHLDTLVFIKVCCLAKHNKKSSHDFVLSLIEKALEEYEFSIEDNGEGISEIKMSPKNSV